MEVARSAPVPGGHWMVSVLVSCYNPITLLETAVMKFDPINQLYYDHTPEEWAEHISSHGPGLTLTGDLARRIGSELQEQQPEQDPASPSSEPQESRR